MALIVSAFLLAFLAAAALGPRRTGCSGSEFIEATANVASSAFAEGRPLEFSFELRREFAIKQSVESQQRNDKGSAMPGNKAARAGNPESHHRYLRAPAMIREEVMLAGGEHWEIVGRHAGSSGGGEHRHANRRADPG